jgi:diguanylate cyclase (GGDEF)-like protein
VTATTDHPEVRLWSLQTYVVTLTALAIAGLGATVWRFGSRPVGNRFPELAMFVLLVIICEIKPILVSSSSGLKEVVASTTFAFAIFLAFGPVLAICAQAAASLVGDLVAKKSPLKMVFNVVQYGMAWVLAAGCLVAFDEQRIWSGGTLNWRWNLAVLAAGIAYFVANNSFVAIAIALSGRGHVWPVIRATIIDEALSDCVLLALSPIVIIVADRNLVLLPLLLLPVFAVYKSASISAEKDHQATHDLLTELPNRLSFAESLQRRLSQPKLRPYKAAVLLLDLDRFKEVNDTLGHHAGDQLLALIGPRIVDVLPPDSIVARLGGDEFAVLLPKIPDEHEVVEIASRVARALDEPFRIDDFNLEVEASIGIALCPDHGQTADILMKHADIAMYAAKGRHSVVELYDSAHDHHSTERLRLVSELRRAIADGEIVVFYQPKLDLASGRVRGVEALVRWIHPQHGLIPPSDFVPVAEHTGLIRPLTSHVLDAAVEQASVWRARGFDLAVAVNLSARSLHDGAIVHDVATSLSTHELPAALLQLEITESSIMADPARARRILDQLDEMGVNISIDDFGTGYSSLAYLQQLPVSEIKIDRSFVTNVLESPADQVIVRSTVDLARNLGLVSTAEGVESAAALRWLREVGCGNAQGYHIARPMPAHAVTQWLSDRHEHARVTRSAPSLLALVGEAGGESS